MHSLTGHRESLEIAILGPQGHALQASPAQRSPAPASENTAGNLSGSGLPGATVYGNPNLESESLKGTVGQTGSIATWKCAVKATHWAGTLPVQTERAWFSVGVPEAWGGGHKRPILQEETEAQGASGLARTPSPRLAPAMNCCFYSLHRSVVWKFPFSILWTVYKDAPSQARNVSAC